MIPDSVLWFLPGLMMVFVVGAAIGLGAGWCASSVLMTDRRGLAADLLVGGFGFLISVVVLSFVPWPERTVTVYENASVTSSPGTNYWPWAIAVLVTAAVTTLHEYNRSQKIT